MCKYLIAIRKYQFRFVLSHRTCINISKISCSNQPFRDFFTYFYLTITYLDLCLIREVWIMSKRKDPEPGIDEGARAAQLALEEGAKRQRIGIEDGKEGSGLGHGASYVKTTGGKSSGGSSSSSSSGSSGTASAAALAEATAAYQQASAKLEVRTCPYLDTINRKVSHHNCHSCVFYSLC